MNPRTARVGLVGAGNGAHAEGIRALFMHSLRVPVCDGFCMAIAPASLSLLSVAPAGVQIVAIKLVGVRRGTRRGMKIVAFGLTNRSPCGNRRATPWRGLCGALMRAGQRGVSLVERDLLHMGLLREDGNPKPARERSPRPAARGPARAGSAGRGDSPRYPAMRLFRQADAGDWNSVVARVSGMRPAGASQRRAETS